MQINIPDETDNIINRTNTKQSTHIKSKTQLGDYLNGSNQGSLTRIYKPKGQIQMNVDNNYPNN